MASDDEKETLYCICRQPYNENEFMIECEACKDWFHGSCVGVLEHQASDIEIYHCPTCQADHGPLVLKQRRNWHRHDYSDSGSAKAVQTGTVMFIKELKGRSFPSADEIPLHRIPGYMLTKDYFDQHGFDLPILVDKKDGLGLTVPHPNFSIQDVEDHVGSMREIDVINVPKQEDHKMLMREWTEYYNSPNRIKIYNVISLEFSKTKLSDLVVVPHAVREISWVCNGVWPESLPDDCPYVKPEVQKYCLMGVRDSFTDFHIDFGGTSVWYHVLRGEKIFYLIKPTSANLQLYETWLNASNQSELFFGDQVDKCYKCIVKQGQTVFIPTGWIHAVFTPIDSLVFGGNFLHSYNIPLQLESYAIEKRVKTPEKYLFPHYETINWYAAKTVLDLIREYTEEGGKPPQYMAEGAKALVYHLRSWSQRKDLNRQLFIKNAKHEVPEYIQYGRLLKELEKEVKICNEAVKQSPTKPRQERKRKKKKGSVKPIEGIDILHQHTQEKLQQMEQEQKKNIYNFEDDDESSPSPLRKPPRSGILMDPDSDGKSLTLKVSNGKIVSEKRAKKGQFQPFVADDGEDSDKETLIVDENPSKSKKAKTKDQGNDQPKLKLKLSFHGQQSSDSSSNSIKKESSSHDPAISQSELSQSDLKSSALLAQLQSLNSSPSVSGKSKVPPISTLLPPRTKSSTQPQLSSPHQQKTPSKAEISAIVQKIKAEPCVIKPELTLSDIINQSALSNSPSTLGKLEIGEDGKPETLEQAIRRNIPTIRGGLNGSIADILEASGYGTETAFTVDDDLNRAPSPSAMREAIQGMLSMSRGGQTGMQLFSRAEGRRQALKKSSLAIEDEEEQLSKCYQDDEFVYPTLEMDEEEQEQMIRAQGKPSKDETWNPKARVNITVPLGERQHREGARKESIKNSLEASAAKIANAPKMKRPYKKKTKLDMDAQPGTSGSSCLAASQSGSAFRPGVKAESSLSGINKPKKPKKGQATAKQRLGKILKIHKMSMY